MANGYERSSDRLLTRVATLDDGDAPGQLVVGDQLLDACDFAGPNGDDDAGDLRDGREGTEAVDKERPGAGGIEEQTAGEVEELLGRRWGGLARRHASAQTRSRENDEDAHKKSSIPRRSAVFGTARGQQSAAGLHPP